MHSAHGPSNGARSCFFTVTKQRCSFVARPACSSGRDLPSPLFALDDITTSMGAPLPCSAMPRSEKSLGAVAQFGYILVIQPEDNGKAAAAAQISTLAPRSYADLAPTFESGGSHTGMSQHVVITVTPVAKRPIICRCNIASNAILSILR